MDVSGSGSGSGAAPRPEAKEPRAEWRVFVPCPTPLTTAALGSEFDGPYDQREGDGVEGRADVYTAVTEAIGLKRRGTKGRWEVKLRVAPPEGATEEEAAADGGIKGVEMWKKWKLGKGLPEEETLAQLHGILGDHGFLDGHVTSLLACEEGRKDVTVAKKRVEKAYEAEGVHTEDTLVEANGKQWRSFAVEGAVDKVKAFLVSHPVGQRLYAHSSDEGAVLHGYPGFLLHV